MSALKRTIFLCLLTCFLKCSVSEEEKNVKTGDNVTLQCQGPRDADIDTVRLNWMRPDLKSEGYLFYFSDHQEQKQHQHFHGRVELINPQMKDGDFSVILKNVNINDTGKYECYVGYKGKKPQLISTINLKVVTSGDVTAKPGDNVNLECQGHRDAVITLVKWDKHGLGQYGVFVFKEKRIYENLQHPCFRGRVELRDPEKKDGDVSVILKNVTFKDTGTYECYVGNKGGKPERLNIINLIAKDTGGGAGHTGIEGEKDGGDRDGHVGITVGLSVFILVAVVSFIIYIKYRKPTGQNNHPPAGKAAGHELQVLKHRRRRNPQFRHELMSQSRSLKGKTSHLVLF